LGCILSINYMLIKLIDVKILLSYPVHIHE
jgi:hypothetical protein